MKQRRGLTLIELLIVLPIVTLIGLIVIQIIFQSWQAYRYSLVQAEASNTLVRSFDRISRVIRSSNRVVAASGTDLTLETYFSPRDDVPDRARYYLSDGEVKVDVIPAAGTAPNYTYPAGSSTTTNLLPVRNDASQPVFRYYDESGNPLTGSYDPAAIRMVEITLVINPDPGVLKADQSSSTRVQLRNLKTNL